MGSKKIQSLIIWLIFHIFLITSVQGQNMTSDRDSLDSLIRDYSLKRIEKGRSGILYNVSLPWNNFSGIEVSIIRIRSRTLWLNGANFSFFYVAPRTLPHPFSRRIALVYQNLGNLSSFYYNAPPNYTFITPVLGLLVYDTNTSGVYNGTLGLDPMKDPILVNFPQVSSFPPGDVITNVNVTTMKCVRFGNNGDVEFGNVTAGATNYSCIANSESHFAIVIPYSVPVAPPPEIKKRKERLWKWWEIGFGSGIVGLILLVGFGIFLCRLMRKKRIGRMEKESERSEALDSIWVGSSRMPSASGIRTQPVLENSYVP